MIRSLAVVAVLTASVSADVIHVPEDQPNIQSAVLVAFNGDEIVLADGVYEGPANNFIDLLAKKITISSANGPDDCLVIGSPGPVFIVQNNETPDTVIEGLGFQGEAFIVHNGAPTVRNCRFWLTNASAVFVTGGTVPGPLFYQCDFDGENAAGGGEPALVYGPARFSSSVFRRYSYGGPGGAMLRIIFSGSVEFTNCLFVDNGLSGGQSRMIRLQNQGAARLVSCTITNNTASEAIFWLTDGTSLRIDN